MQRLKDLPGWVPQPCNSKAAGDTFPMTADQVTIERVIWLKDGHLVFACRFGRELVFHDFQHLDDATGELIGKILDENRGKTLLSVGAIEIPAN